MIVGIGCDIVYISRMEKLFDNYTDKLLKKVFHDYEINEVNKLPLTNKNKKIAYLAKRFSAKEAFVKALGVGFGQHISMKDIYVVNNEQGKPEILLTEKAKEYLQNIFKAHNINIHLSLSDEKDLVCSMVVVEALAK